MQSVIILGTTEKTREKANQILSEYKISNFDASVFSSDKAIGIPEVRLLQKNIFLKPFASEKKAVVLECFCGVTVDAQNAFLKVLEEPPTDTIIMLLATSLDFILPTVLSRCNLIDLTSRIQQLPKQRKENLELLESLVFSAENPLLIAQNYGKSKESALKILEELITAAEEKMQTDHSLAKTLKELQKTYTIIKSTNVNVRFALENLFLNLK